MLRDALHNKVKHKHPVLSAVERSLNIFTNMQRPGQGLDDYLTMFNLHVEQVKAHVGQP